MPNVPNVVVNVYLPNQQTSRAVAEERDLLARQLQSVHALAARCETARRDIAPSEIYQLLITDPADMGVAATSLPEASGA